MTRRRVRAVELDDDFSIERNNYEWVLSHHYLGKSKKTGEDKVITKKTYHPNLGSVARRILDRRAEGCETLEQLMAAFDTGEMALTRRLEEAVEEVA